MRIHLPDTRYLLPWVSGFINTKRATKTWDVPTVVVVSQHMDRDTPRYCDDGYRQSQANFQRIPLHAHCCCCLHNRCGTNGGFHSRLSCAAYSPRQNITHICRIRSAISTFVQVHVLGASSLAPRHVRAQPSHAHDPLASCSSSRHRCASLKGNTFRGSSPGLRYAFRTGLKPGVYVNVPFQSRRISTREVTSRRQASSLACWIAWGSDRHLFWFSSYRKQNPSSRLRRVRCSPRQHPAALGIRCIMLGPLQQESRSSAAEETIPNAHACRWS